MEQILLESQNKVLGQVKKGALSIRSLNHVSFSVPEPVKTGKFFCEILGFRVVGLIYSFEYVGTKDRAGSTTQLQF